MATALFSGVKPTGELHLGNYLGALRNWVALQKDYRCLYSVVDLHALTIAIAPEELRANTRNVVIDLLAIGVDPQRSVLFRQSEVPEHAELTWLLSCMTPVPELERMTQYKDLVQTHKKVANTGMLTYPVLMAADILLYKAGFVPVGEDQLQHLELTRIIARKFNNRYGREFFPEVKPILAEDVRIMSLSHPAKKMSKSLGVKSYLALRDDAATIRAKLSKAVTDSQDDGTTLSGGHNLLTLYKHFGKPDRYQEFKAAYELKKLSYAALKAELADALVAHLEPIQEKQRYYAAHPKEVDAILAEGREQAQKIARQTLDEVREIIGLA